MFEQNGFFLIDDEGTRLRLVREGARNQSAATLWTPGRTIVLRLRILEFDIQKNLFRTSLPDGPSLKRVLAILSSDSGVFFNVELADTHILFQTTLKEFDHDNGILSFNNPEAVYKIQQRKHPRLIIEKPSSVRAFHDDPLQPGRSIQRRVVDLSIGGMSMRLFFGEERHYRIGQSLNSIRLQIGQKFVPCSGQIQNIRVFKHPNGASELIMGITFLEMTEAAQSTISTFVDRELLKLFGRMLTKQTQDHG